MITITFPTGWSKVTLCPWVRVDKVTVPKFIEERAKGNMRMIDGNIYEKYVPKPSGGTPVPAVKWRWERYKPYNR